MPIEHISVKEFASRNGLSERTVRNYCAVGRIEGAVLVGKTWSIPADAVVAAKTRTSTSNALLKALREQMEMGMKGGIYHHTQVDLTYNSNHIEGSRLTHDQTRFIFETNTIGITDETVRVDDIMETVNHFRCIDHIILHAEERLTEGLIKQLHGMLKAGTSDSRKSWFVVGDYKKLPNEVGGIETAAPKDVHKQIKLLLKEYNSSKQHTLDEILDFHHRFEVIHPFQDGNGRVGRLVMFKECLRNGIVPFIITEQMRDFYYRGLQQWTHVPDYLRDTCLAAQDDYKLILDYFKIKYKA